MMMRPEQLFYQGPRPLPRDLLCEPLPSVEVKAHFVKFPGLFPSLCHALALTENAPYQSHGATWCTHAIP